MKGIKRKLPFRARGGPRSPADARRGKMGLLRRPEDAKWCLKMPNGAAEEVRRCKMGLPRRPEDEKWGCVAKKGLPRRHGGME